MSLAAIGAAVLLVAVAGASGSRVQPRSVRVTQKAVEAPHTRGASLDHVVCRTRGGCVATGTAPHGGTLVLGERGGRWTVEASLADVSLTATDCLYGYGTCGPVLACPSVGSCAAVGHGSSSPRLLTQTGRSWSSSEPQFPSELGNAGLSTLSCGSPGNCTAVGSSQPDYSTRVPLLFSERSGAWGTGVVAQLPPDVSTTFDPVFAFGGGFLSVVACPSAANCVAAGSYGEKGAGEYGPGWLAEPWITTKQAGQWQPGVKVQLPADANTTSYFENDPFIGFTGLSCPSVGNCTAVGGYDGAGGEQGLILTVRNGVWSHAIRAPLPAGHLPLGGPNELDNPLGAVSCADRNDCAAIGILEGYNLGQPLGWLLSERHGRWKASIAKVALPDGKTSEWGAVDVFLSSVACASASNCVAVGTYHSGKYGLILVDHNGKWQAGVRPARPANAATKKAWTNLNWVSCPSANRCTVVGSYNDRRGKSQGLIINLRLH